MTIKNQTSESTHKDNNAMPVEKSDLNLTLHQSDHLKEDVTSPRGEKIGLDHCAPFEIESLGNTPRSGHIIIERDLQGQYFIAFGQSKTVACAIERIRNDHGKVVYEIYYPVPYPFQRRLCIPVRLIAFNACCSPLGPFIFAHKLTVPGFPPNSWNESIRTVLSKAEEGWVSVYPDKIARKFECMPMPPPFMEEPDYPGFEEDLEKVLAPNIIGDLEHPAIQRILSEREQIEDIIDLESWVGHTKANKSRPTA